MNTQQQSEIYLTRIANRNRNPVKPSTLAIYRSYLNVWILPEIGSLPVAKIDNETLNQIVMKMVADKMSPATITGVINTVKEVVGSCRDRKGKQLYDRTWDAELIDCPIVEARKQKAPMISQLEAESAILRAGSPYDTLFCLLAGTGLRIGEALALKARPNTGSSFYDPDRSVLVVQTTMFRGTEQTTKTPAGVREIDLHPALNSLLIEKSPSTGKLFPVRRTTAYQIADETNVPGFHSFRRFRKTHLQMQNVPDGLTRFWMGHADKDVADRYVKIGANIEARKEWAVKAGLGFELP